MSASEKLVVDSPAEPAPEGNDAQVKFSKDSESIDVKPDQKLIGLTKEQLERYRNDPFWKPVRYLVFTLFWVIWAVMFVGAILIVVMSPKCAAKKEQAWFQSTVAYQIFTPTFRDSDQDGVGDLRGVKDKLNDLRRVGVKSVWPTPILKSLKDEFNPAAIVDVKQVDSRFGTEEDLKELIGEAHNLGLQFIADLPLTVSKESPLASKGLGQGKVRLLDLTKSEVVAELKQAAIHLLDYGVDGIHLAQYGLTYPSSQLSALQRLASEIRAAAPEHFHEDEPLDLLIFSDAPAVRSDRSVDLYTRPLFRFPNQTQAVCQSAGFIKCFIESARTGAAEIARNSSALPIWQLGDVSHIRPDFRAPAELVPRASVAATAIQLFLPGSVAVYYGEELGLPGVDDQQSQHGLMVWSDQKSGGFSEFDGTQFFKQLSAKQVKALNFKTQYDENHSPLKGFKKLAQLRTRDEVFLEGNIIINEVNGVYVFSRILDGNEKAYILAVNWPALGAQESKLFAVTRDMVPNHKVTNSEIVWNQPHNRLNPSQLITGSTKLVLNPFEYALIRVNID